MVYYHICLRKHASNMCTIILPLVKCWNKLLPMGVINPLDIFQEKMNKMFRGFEIFRAYINDLSIITKGDWSDQLEKLETNIKNLKDNGLKCNIEKSFLGQTKMEYLSF